jgi:hypothetical protein
MFDQEIAHIIKTGHPPDRIPYTCSRCGSVTYAPPSLKAIVCRRCGLIDLGTELALNRWRAAVSSEPWGGEIAHAIVLVVGILALVLS